MNSVSENFTSSANADKVSKSRRKSSAPTRLPDTDSLAIAPLDETMIALLESEAQALADRAKWGAAARALLRVARVEPHDTERWLKIAQWQRQDHDAKAAARTLRTALRLNARNTTKTPPLSWSSQRLRARSG